MHGLGARPSSAGRRVFAEVWGRTASAWTPKARCGCLPAASRSPASRRAAKSCHVATEKLKTDSLAMGRHRRPRALSSR
jgi:hypothetical protein